MENDLAQYVQASLNLHFTPQLNSIFKGGSDRTFYRTAISTDMSIVVMHYQEERRENALYADIANFLRAAEVPAPKIHAHCPERNFICMQDLGERDLHSMSHSDWETRKKFYQKTLIHARRLHDEAYRIWQSNPVPLMDGFDLKLYHWEHGYFAKECVGRLFGQSLSQDVLMEQEQLAKRMLSHEISLVHRDFQSQNIMIYHDDIYFIDFQGLRQGSRFYDLASLLFDPYVSITQQERHELALFYYEHTTPLPMAWTDFEKSLHDAAAQRLMQALGAYGFLSMQKGKKQFLHHVKPALANLQIAAQQQLPSTAALASALRQEWEKISPSLMTGVSAAS